jgi:hypothetical protein
MFNKCIIYTNFRYILYNKSLIIKNMSIEIIGTGYHKNVEIGEKFFEGIIKNKSELKVLLTQLNII